MVTYLGTENEKGFYVNANEQLERINQQLIRDELPERVSVRTLLTWFHAKRRGFYIVYDIRSALNRHDLITDPDFNAVYIDALVRFKRKPEVSNVSPVVVDEAEPTVRAADPSNRIGKLVAANNPPTPVNSNAPLNEAVTLMLLNRYSQLPVMQGERDVKGIVSWQSMAKRLSLGKACTSVKDCMEPAHIIRSDFGLFEAIPGIVEHGYALVRGDDLEISGIVTTSDLAVQLQELGEPFLVLGEIENAVRGMIGERFTRDELLEARDPGDDRRVVNSAADLTFGEYIRLIEKPERWDKLEVPIDRQVFIRELELVRRIRNDVMHFDPDGIPDEDLATLRSFVVLTKNLRELGFI